MTSEVAATAPLKAVTAAPAACCGGYSVAGEVMVVGCGVRGAAAAAEGNCKQC